MRQVPLVPADALTSAVLRLLAELDTLEGPRARPVTDAARERLQAPVRAVVTGRVSSGKSTLVNALVGAHVAATAARELTAVVTSIGFGAPARAVLSLADGTTVECGVGADGVELDPDSEVEHVRLRVPQGVLRGLTLVDTPGLGSSTSDAWGRAAAQVVAALGGVPPDVVLHVVRDGLRDSDRAMLGELCGAWVHPDGRLPRTVVVLSHADNFGAGPWEQDDPIQAASAAATALVREEGVEAAVALSGLLAETARTGRWRESHLRALRRMTGVPDEDLGLAVQLAESDTVDVAEAAALHALLGGYGMRHGRDQAGSSTQLRGWLERVSGIAVLEGLLGTDRAAWRTCGRVDAVLEEVARAAHASGWSGDAEAALERARAAPGMHALMQWRAAEELRRTEPRHELVAELDRLLAGEQVVTAAEAWGRASAHQAGAAVAPSGAAAQASRVLSRSYVLIARAQEERADA